MMKRIFHFFWVLYKITLSPLLNRYTSCRYEPSCSLYCKQAIEKYGFWYGCVKGIRRFLSCHPFSHRPIYDPVDD